MIPRPPRHKRPVRFNRNRANPIQRLPFYRPSLARVGDYWRMPEAHGYLMNREVGRVCAIAFVQALAEATETPGMTSAAHLAHIVASAVESHGGALSESQRGLIDGFFGPHSVLAEVVRRGMKSGAPTLRYTVDQLEGALTDLASCTTEEYALRRIGSVAGAIPDPASHPAFWLE